MNIPGHWFEAGSAARYDATLVVDAERCRVEVDGQIVATGDITELRISDRVGNIARHLHWPDNGKFETLQNDAIDQMLRANQPQGSATVLIWRLESSWVVAIAALFLVVGALFAGYKWGIPAAADRVALSLPAPVTETISEGAMATLDNWIFEQSELSADEQTRIRDQFSALTERFSDSGVNYRLHFRKMTMNEEPVPNAMALPNGEIVVTDAFVELVEHPAEISAVLLHEIGHVEERHGLRQVVRASALSVIAGMTLGNMSGVGELVSGVPVFLAQSSYSREHETSADAFAFDHMMDAGIDPIHFANIIARLGGVDADAEPARNNYLASHPSTANRARRAAELSRQFNNRSE
jgi:Zn-dependent protease with chaperone function